MVHGKSRKTQLDEKVNVTDMMPISKNRGFISDHNTIFSCNNNHLLLRIDRKLFLATSAAEKTDRSILLLHLIRVAC